jgi:hypothetical protein
MDTDASRCGEGTKKTKTLICVYPRLSVAEKWITSLSESILKEKGLI